MCYVDKKRVIEYLKDLLVEIENDPKKNNDHEWCDKSIDNLREKIEFGYFDEQEAE